MSSEKGAGLDLRWQHVGAVVGGGLAIYVVGGWLTVALAGGLARAAQWGDAVGPVSALFSSLALAVAVLAVFLQRADLKAQKDELAETRNVFVQQQRAQEELTEAQRLANNIAVTQLEQQRRDHWLQREAHRTAILNLQFTVWHAGIEGDVNGDTNQARELRRIIMQLDMLWERERDERISVLRARIVARADELGPDQPTFYRVHNLDRLGHEPGRPPQGWRDDGLAMDYDDRERAVSNASMEHSHFGDRVIVLDSDGRIAWDSDPMESAGRSRSAKG